MGREEKHLHVSGSPPSPKMWLKKANLEMLRQLLGLAGLYTFKMIDVAGAEQSPLSPDTQHSQKSPKNKEYLLK